MNRKRLSYFILLYTSGILSSVLTFQCALAQEASVSASPAPVQYIVSPQNPGPNSTVYIEIQGVGTFLGNSPITWKKNGVPVSSGQGLRTFTFTTAKIGTPTSISVTITSSSYGTITHTFNFNPSRISLVWEANTTAPPFYQGKSMPTPGSQVHVVAFPEVFIGGVAENSRSLSYQWKLDDEPQPSASGMGASTFNFTANQLHQNAKVSVDVVSSSGTNLGHAEILIPFLQPLIVLYVHDPLRGILYNSALPNSYTMTAKEQTIKAEGYFFSRQNFTRNFSYSWQLNGNQITGPTTSEGELTLRQTGNGGGAANLTVSLQSSGASTLLQAAQTDLSILFGSSQNSIGSSLFGL